MSETGFTSGGFRQDNMSITTRGFLPDFFPGVGRLTDALPNKNDVLKIRESSKT